MPNKLSVAIVSFIIICIFQLTGCQLRQKESFEAMNESDYLLSNSEIVASKEDDSYQVNIVTISIYDGQTMHMLNPYDNKYLVDVFNSHCDDLIHDVYKFSYDYSFMVNNDDRWDYCSDSGAFCNKSKQQSFLIDELEKKEVNLIIEYYLNKEK